MKPDLSDLSNSHNLCKAHLLEQLACPVCRGDLKLAEKGAFILCASCARTYPFVDGIPVLIAERAILKV